MPVVIGGDNLPSPVRIGLTDLTIVGGPVAPLAPPVPAPLSRQSVDMKFKTPLIWYDVQQNWAKIFIVKKVDNFSVQIPLPFWCSAV